MWTVPAPSKPELDSLYQARYRQIRAEALTDEHLLYKDARAAAQRAFILRHTTIDQLPRLRMLDIGCAAGSLLLSFDQLRIPADLVGFEPDHLMAAAARSRLHSNARIHASTFESTHFPSGQFDLVTASHSLEHVAEPVPFLSDLWRITCPNGVLFLEVPHETRQSVRRIVAAKHRGLMHLLFFSVESLRKALKKAGWRTVHVSTFGPDHASFSVVPTRPGAFSHFGSRLRRRILRYVGRTDPQRPPIDWIRAYGQECPERGIWIRAVAEKGNRDANEQ
jgi:2-polyprenyl-3-methyl-5-hydroxy-6-metoxy-1,4-benzoquinol methylase